MSGKDAEWHRTYDALLSTEALKAAGRAVSDVEAKRSAAILTFRSGPIEPITHEDSAKAAIEAALDVAREMRKPA